MPDATTTWAADLTTLLSDQCAMIAELKPLAERQGALIEGGDIAGLLDLLGRRQSIVDRFGATERRLVELTSGLPARLTDLPPDRRATLSALVSRVDEGLRDVAAADQRDATSLRDGRDATVAEIESLGAAAAARKAYLGAGAGAARFADRTG